jgi:hypothetical protein
LQPPPPPDPNEGSNSGLPIPRFVSLRAALVAGPGLLNGCPRRTGFEVLVRDARAPLPNLVWAPSQVRSNWIDIRSRLLFTADVELQSQW